MKVFSKISFFSGARGAGCMAQHLYSGAVLFKIRPGHWLSLGLHGFPHSLTENTEMETDQAMILSFETL